LRAELLPVTLRRVISVLLRHPTIKITSTYGSLGQLLWTSDLLAADERGLAKDHKAQLNLEAA
jgi:ketopantoate hydroxymethyltransferase